MQPHRARVLAAVESRTMISAMSDLASMMAGPIAPAAIDDLADVISKGGSLVDVAFRIPRDTAVKILDFLKLENTVGAAVLPAREEVSPAAAATMLGIARQTVIESIEAGDLSARKAGLRWWIAASDLVSFAEGQKRSRRQAADRLAMLTADVA